MERLVSLVDIVKTGFQVPCQNLLERVLPGAASTNIE